MQLLQDKKKLTQITVSVVVLIFFLIVSGCSILSFFKKKDVNSAESYKKKLESKYNSVLTTVKKFNELSNLIEKDYYSTNDFTSEEGFYTRINTLKTEISQAVSNLNEANAAAVKFEQTSTGGKYSAYITARKKSIESMKNALEQENKVVEVFSAKTADLQGLFTYIDDLRKAQSGDSTALKIIRSRDKESKDNEAYYNIILSLKNTEAQTATDVSTATTAAATDQTNNSNTTDQSATNTSSQTTTDTSSTTQTNSSSSDSDDIPDYVYEILGNKTISLYFIDFIIRENKKLDSLYTNVYQADRKIKFNSSAKMLDNIEVTGNDMSDFKSSTEDLRENIITVNRESKRLTVLENQKKSLNALIAELNNAINTRPSSVTSSSLESQGYEKQLANAKEDLSKCNSNISALKTKISNLRTAQSGRLQDNFENDWWKAAGSLYQMINLNEHLMNDVMKDIHSWKDNRIDKYLKKQSYYLKLAKYQSIRAEIEFKETNNNVALLK